MNRLQHETSPYLLQHAHNPVDWYPWGEEALNRAKEENKPILVSIGYAACHWCHVMERESFESAETAAYMNEHFINIKIDREERPDLDHIYMDAVQAMTGSGGWPLNVFLTPDKRPFYGGTYFPPRRAFNRPSWMETLSSVALAFREKRNEIDAQAENLTTHLKDSNEFGQHSDQDLSTAAPDLRSARDQLMKNADREWGGFGKAPKFPQTFSIEFLLRYYHVTGDQEALEQALLSLDKMIQGGIYDQLGGGFARYSTDTEWLAPHFEKMLYDNALLISVLSEAFQLTGEPRYKEVIVGTMAFIERELMDERSGFYAALDADSEGVEGKFYTWSKEEIDRIAGVDADLFETYYDVSSKGNWEHTNILRVKKEIGKVAEEFNLEIQEAKERISKVSTLLMAERSKRVRPLLDDKVILGWNALMNTAVSKAFSATGIKRYRELATENMIFLLEHFFNKSTERFYHTWKNNAAKYPAFLDDHALLIDALINLQEITGDAGWLEKAKWITEMVERDFNEEGTPHFYYTPSFQNDVIVRKKEVYDGALPSGNSVMAFNLHRLGILFDKESWRSRARSMLGSMQQVILKYPGSFGNWACLLQEMVQGTEEVVIAGPASAALHQQILGLYLPHRILMVANDRSREMPLVVGKEGDSKACVYLCSNYTCYPSVFTVEELILLRNRLKKV